MFYYVTTEFGYAKHDLRVAAYGGVVLQRFQGLYVENGNRIITESFIFLQ